jgi:hypothetical protein
MKVQDIPKSGKRGNVVAFKSRYGQVERQHVAPKKRQSAAQRRTANEFGRASSGWNSLTDEQRDAWRACGKKTRSHPRGGKSGPLSGQNLLTAINRNQALLGLAPFVYPPERPTLGPCPLVRLRIVHDSDGIAIKLTVPEAFDGYILAYGSRSYSVGRQYCDKFRYLTPLQAPAGGEVDITQPYIERFGKPRAGARIFIRTEQQVNGWRGIPRRTSAIVPAA